MAEQEIQYKATEPTEKRSLTTDLATHFAEGVTMGAGLATGKVIVDQVVGHVTNKPQDPPSPKIELPSGYEED